MRKIVASLVFLACLAMIAGGCNAGTAEDINISEVWARPAAKGENSAVYFLLENPTDNADVLLSASGDIAAMVELHLSKMENDVMKMEHQEKVEVPANQTLEFKPGGLHVMLMNLNQDLKVGDRFDLTLLFDQAGSKTIQVTVKQP